MGLLKWILKADWDSAYVNALPNSAFLFVDDDGKRHLPYKDAEGKVDEAHLDNALSRLGQSATGANWPGFDREKVKAKAEKIKASLSKADSDGGNMAGEANAVLEAVFAACEEYGVKCDGGFTLYPVADQDGDADGDGQTLYCCCVGGYDFYALCSGGKAEVVAYYCYAEMYMSCREDVGEELMKQDEAADSREGRDAAILRAAKPKKRPGYGTYKVLKSDSEQQYTLGVAYPHDEVDAHGEYTDETHLELAAWNFMRGVIAKGEHGVGTDHADGTDGAATVVESYIYRGPEWKGEDGETIAKAGDWLVGALWSDDAWERVKKDADEPGALTGWSIQGLAFRVEEDDAE